MVADGNAEQEKIIQREDYSSSSSPEGDWNEISFASDEHDSPTSHQWVGVVFFILLLSGVFTIDERRSGKVEEILYSHIDNITAFSFFQISAGLSPEEADINLRLRV